MMNKIAYILFIFCAVLCTSCQHNGKTPKATVGDTINRSSVPQDEEVRATSETNSGGLASKGTIVSAYDVPVYSMVSEVIKQRYIKEGMHVSKGQVLFTLDRTMQQSEIEKTMREIEQARFQYDNILVGQGYDTSKPQTIPAKIRSIARTRSSLNLYEQTLNQQKLMSAYYTIHAPISGVVTDVKAYQYDLAEKGKELCRIIDTTNLQVVFSILESELSKFEPGSLVHFSTIAYPNITYSAKVVQISPKVDENGMVRIKATIIHDSNFSKMKTGMTTIVKK